MRTLLLPEATGRVLICVLKLVPSLLTGRKFGFLSIWTGTSRPRRAEVHDHGCRALIMHLVSSSGMPLHLWRQIRLLLVMLGLLGQIFAPADTSAILYGSVLLIIITKLKTSSVHVLAMLVPVQFLFARRSLVGHRNVVLAGDPASNGRNVLHLSVRV